MVFTAEPMQGNGRAPKPKKANYPFDAMRDTPNTGFVIPASQEAEFFQHCRIMASTYNKKHGTSIRCNKQADGSLRVWNEKTEQPQANTAELLQASITIADKRKEQSNKVRESEQPTEQQFKQWINSRLQPGMSYTFQLEYIHRFEEFKQWAADIPNCETEVEFNPPKLKIKRSKAV